MEAEKSELVRIAEEGMDRAHASAMAGIVVYAEGAEKNGAEITAAVLLDYSRAVLAQMDAKAAEYFEGALVRLRGHI